MNTKIKMLFGGVAGSALLAGTAFMAFAQVPSPSPSPSPTPAPREYEAAIPAASLKRIMAALAAGRVTSGASLSVRQISPRAAQTATAPAFLETARFVGSTGETVTTLCVDAPSYTVSLPPAGSRLYTTTDAYLQRSSGKGLEAQLVIPLLATNVGGRTLWCLGETRELAAAGLDFLRALSPNGSAMKLHVTKIMGDARFAANTACKGSGVFVPPIPVGGTACGIGGPAPRGSNIPAAVAAYSCGVTNGRAVRAQVRCAASQACIVGAGGATACVAN